MHNHLNFKKNNIIFHLATSKQASDMVAFHNSYYGKSRSPKDWLWEYQGYDAKKAVSTFATDSDKIIATQGMLPIYMKVGTKTILSGKSESTLLIPAYRGTQLMQGLYEYAIENCIERKMKFIWGFTPAVQAFKNFGFKSYPDIRVMMRPCNLWVGIRLRLNNGSLPWRRIASIGKLMLRHFLFKKNLTVNQFHEKEYKLRREIADEISLKALFDRLTKQHKKAIFIQYDQKYLKWRVRKHPFIKYIEYQVYCCSELKAFAIVALHMGVLSISDLTSEDENATSFLIHTILDDFSEKAGEIRCLLNTKDILSQGVLKQLCKSGFSTSDTWNLVVRDLTNGDHEEIFDICNWHINGLWTEGYSM